MKVSEGSDETKCELESRNHYIMERQLNKGNFLGSHNPAALKGEKCRRIENSHPHLQELYPQCARSGPPGPPEANRASRGPP